MSVAVAAATAYWCELPSASEGVWRLLAPGPTRIEFQQAGAHPRLRDVGYFLQKDVEIIASKTGWWSKCYGEAAFRNGDEVHVVSESGGDYLLGGFPVKTKLRFLATFHPRNARETMLLRLVCDDGVSEWQTAAGAP